MRLLSCIRLDEVLLLQGAPLLGALFAIPEVSHGSLLPLLVLLAGCLCLIAHVFLFNDWSGIKGDLRDPKRAARTFAAVGVGRAAVGWLALGLLLSALVVLAWLGRTPFAFGVAIAVLSALYSAPALHGKGRPLFSSLLHIVGGSLLFLLGYTTFAAIDLRGAAISGFFALVFAAGHLANEARDHEGDARNGIRTNAVAFGRARGFVAALVLFAAAYLLLAVLALAGYVPLPLLAGAALLPLHLLAARQAWRAGLSFESLRRLQWIYRGLFAVIGLLMLSTVPHW